jgi:hypothetical protein
MNSDGRTDRQTGKKDKQIENERTNGRANLMKHTDVSYLDLFLPHEKKGSNWEIIIVLPISRQVGRKDIR